MFNTRVKPLTYAIQVLCEEFFFFFYNLKSYSQEHDMFHCKWKMTELKRNIKTEISNFINFYVWVIKDIVNKKPCDSEMEFLN